MHVEAVGIFCLGLFIGYLCWYFVVRIGRAKVTPDTFASVTGVVAGGVVIKLLKGSITTPADSWWYPIGLVAGFALYVVLSTINQLVKKPVAPALVGGDEPQYPNALGLFD